MNNRRPITTQMQSALALLASTRDRALVRLWSQWWCSESERDRAGDIGAFHRTPSGNVVGPSNSTAALGNDNPWPVLLVSTSTVNALVTRGYLKFSGPKREPNRAELSSFAIGGEDDAKVQLSRVV